MTPVDTVSQPLVLGWLKGYRREWLSGDIFAGITAAAVVIPQAMGYASVAGLPVQMGLYTCMVPMLVYALLGGARRMSLSTTSTIVALAGLAFVAAGVDPSGAEGVAAATTLTLLVGISLILMRILRLGWMVEAVNEAVLIGLKLGVGFTIMADQVPKLLGIPAADGGFFADVANALRRLDETDATTAILAFGTIGTLIVLRQWLPRIPGPLIALAGGIILVATLGLDEQGVALISPVPSGLPLPEVPALSHVEQMLPYAVVIALMAFLESISVSRSTRSLDDPALDNHGEMVAIGAASIAGSFFQAMPAGGGFSQTMVNSDAGARTQLSELVTATLAVAVALFLAPLLNDLPQATLGAIVVVAVIGLVALGDLFRLAQFDRVEFWVAVATGFFCLLTNLLVGVIVGVVLTLYLVMRALNHPVVVELRRPESGAELLPAAPGYRSIPGLLALRIEGGLYTVNVRSVQNEIYRQVAAHEPPPEVVLLDVGGTSDTSITVLDVFAETDQQLARRGVTLWVAALPTRAVVKAQRTAAWIEWSQAGRLHSTVNEAVKAYELRSKTAGSTEAD